MELLPPATALEYHPLYINGEWCDPADGATFTVTAPATGEPLASVASAGPADVDRAIAAARMAFDSGPWPHSSPAERARVLTELTAMLEDRAFALAEIDAREGGVPIRKTTYNDVTLAIEIFRTFAEIARRPPYEPLPWTDMPSVSWNFVWREPIGVCAQIIPWNYTVAMAAWKLAPALASGNTVVFKPSSLAPLTSIELVRVINESGLLPRGVVNLVNGPGGSVGEYLVAHPAVDKIAFSGSTEVGRKVMVAAAQGLKKVTLELGGKSPALVLPDADLDTIVDGLLFGAFYHAGQLCEAGTRILVHHSQHDELVERLVARTNQIRIGDPLDLETDMGPLISFAQREKVEEYIRIGQAEGARIVVGGGRPQGEQFARGPYIEPTIFVDVNNRSRLAQEEIFGPVLAVIRYDDVTDALRMANETPFGLAASVWTRDLQAGIAVAQRIRAGTVWINESLVLNANAPFGGYKQSGIGREMGLYGIHEYTEAKHIHVDLMQKRQGRLWRDALLPE
jgi:aldehyde dehydrogenase (NAD+)